MCCKSFWKRIIPFALAFMFGLFAVNILGQENPKNKNQEKIKSCNLLNGGSGMSSGDRGYPFGVSFDDKSSITYSSGTKPLQIIRKPIAKYTDEARENCIEGIVRLKITFFANGKVGNFSVAKGLPHGLTEQAIAAVMQIKFKPAIRDKKPISKTVILEYNFTIY